MYFQQRFGPFTSERASNLQHQHHHHLLRIPDLAIRQPPEKDADVGTASRLMASKVSSCNKLAKDGHGILQSSITSHLLKLRRGLPW